jgi:hypothetical protein
MAWLSSRAASFARADRPRYTAVTQVHWVPGGAIWRQSFRLEATKTMQSTYYFTYKFSVSQIVDCNRDTKGPPISAVSL